MRHATLLRIAPLSFATIAFAASSADPGAGSAPWPAGGETTVPQLESRVDPVYPPDARDAGLEADLVLQVVVDEDGTVPPERIQCVRCSVSRRGREAEEVLRGWCGAFLDAAVSAVGQWRYAPATRDGEPVAVYFAIPLSFALERGDRQ